MLRGGKRIRPAFAWTGWLGAGGDPGGADAQAVLRACSALELVQACALIHDDIIDSSRTRRGFPTVHVDFDRPPPRARAGAGTPRTSARASAILLGDLALCWADDMVARIRPRPDGRAPRFGRCGRPCAPRCWAASCSTCTAEAGADEAVAAALRVNRYKTAAYTVERPLHLGAALAGADADLIAAYRAFGADIGIAFQLRDDLLGVFGDPGGDRQTVRRRPARGQAHRARAPRHCATPTPRIRPRRDCCASRSAPT